MPMHCNEGEVLYSQSLKAMLPSLQDLYQSEGGFNLKVFRIMIHKRDNYDGREIENNVKVSKTKVKQG